MENDYTGCELSGGFGHKYDHNSNKCEKTTIKCPLNSGKNVWSGTSGQQNCIKACLGPKGEHEQPVHILYGG